MHHLTHLSTLQTLLLGENVQKAHISGIRIKALRSLISRPVQDTIIALNAVIRKRMKVTHLSLLRALPTSSITGRRNMALTKMEN
jgi:hypothetical protein